MCVRPLRHLYGYATADGTVPLTRDRCSVCRARQGAVSRWPRRASLTSYWCAAGRCCPSRVGESARRRCDGAPRSPLRREPRSVAAMSPPTITTSQAQQPHNKMQ